MHLPITACTSGVVEVQMDFKEEDERICSATTQCTISLLVPLNSGVDLAGKSLACVRLAPEDQEFTVATLQTDLEIRGGTHVACEVTRLGRYVVCVGPIVCGWSTAGVVAEWPDGWQVQQHCPHAEGGAWFMKGGCRAPGAVT